MWTRLGEPPEPAPGQRKRAKRSRAKEAFLNSIFLCYNQHTLTAGEVKGKGRAASRAGTKALSLLAAPLNAALILALAEEPRALPDLRREAGAPPQTTMRNYMRALSDRGIIERRRNDFPGNVEAHLTDSGRELLTVARVLSTWLAHYPEGPTALGGRGAKNAVTALVDGWSTGMIRALAARPLTLTELNSVIKVVSYPSLERRLGAMRLTGLVARRATTGRGRPHGATEWLRRAVAPLTLAAAWERRRLRAEASAIGRHDVEAALLLSLPLLRLATERAGRCRLVVELAGAEGPVMAGAVAVVEDGRVLSCGTRLTGDVDAWVSGSASAWLAATAERDAASLEVGGDSALAFDLVEGFHGAVCGATLAAGNGYRVRLNS